jgi:hypothetical protein
MKVLLVEPDYYTRYPPLGLLKLAAFHKKLGDEVRLVRAPEPADLKAQRVYVTSLFTWDWKAVWQAVRFYRTQQPMAEIWLGGIYASLLPDHARLSGADRVWERLFPEAELEVPDYSLVPEWKASLLFATRGCTRRCGFCSVPKLEGPLQPRHGSVRRFIYPGHSKLTFFDNNILGSSIWRDVFLELIDLHIEVDFNQGMDARYLTEEAVALLAKMRCPIVRLAYDYIGVRPYVENAINLLKRHGISGRRVVFYVLYNYIESPGEFFEKVRDLLNWGVVAYPMRYEPLCTLEKGKYVSAKWTKEELDMVAGARRVIGFGGAFPPYVGLVEKFRKAQSFHDAFALRQPREQSLPPAPIVEMALEHQQQATLKRHYFPAWRREKNWRTVLTNS